MLLLSQLSDTIPASHEPYFFTGKFAAQFAKMLKQCDECYCFMLNFTNCVAHRGNKVSEVNQHSEHILDEVEKGYLAVFSEPTYPTWEYRQPL